MEAIIFCGIQATGKTTFYVERFVMDNANPTRADRQRYIRAARQAKYEVIALTGLPFVLSVLFLDLLSLTAYLYLS